MWSRVLKAAVLSLVVLTLAVGATAQQAKPVEIGVITPLTGSDAAYGTYTRNGLEVALKQLGPAAPVRLVYKDSKADPQEALRVFKELRAAGVPVVIGPFTSTEVKQVGPESDRARVVLVTTSATSDELSKTGDHVFMMLPPNSQQGSDQARFAASKLGAKRAAILYRQNPYGTTLRASFVETFRALGGEIVKDESFPDGGVEQFTDRLRNIAAANPDVVFIPAHYEDTGRILRQAREVNFPRNARFLGGDGSMSEKMIELAGGAAEGSVYSNVLAADDSFVKAYRAAYGDEPSPYAASAYDTLRVLAQLASNGARTAAQFRSALVGLKGFQGATGTTQFTQREKAYWCLDKRYGQFEVKDGRFQVVR